MFEMFLNNKGCFFKVLVPKLDLRAGVLLPVEWELGEGMRNTTGGFTVGS